MTFGRNIVMSISKGLGYLVLATTALFYDIELVSGTSEKVIPIALSGVAVIGLIAGLCFSFAQSEDDVEQRRRLTHTGEKFFHSCLLFIQVIFVRYATDRLLALPSMNADPKGSSFVATVSTIMLAAISLYGTYFFIYGFKVLNTQLWIRFQRRVDEGQAG
jgi:hypothetical protein